MVFIPGHPIILDLRPRPAGGTTARLAATATVKPRNLGNGLHPAPLQRTRPGSGFGRFMYQYQELTPLPPRLAWIWADRRRASAQHDAIPGPDGGTSGVGFLGAVEAGQSIKSTNEK